MFERRLKILLLVLTLPVVAICTRLFQLQVLRADWYRESAQKMLLRPVHEYPFIRGDITDHEGRRLAFDAPVWDICVHYGLIVQDRAYLRAVAKKRYPLLPQDEAAASTLRDIQASWGQISTLSGTSLDELNARCEIIRRRVAAIKLHVETRRRVETIVQEEQMVHPVVQGLDQNQQVLARERLNTYEWIEIVAAQKRRYAGGPAVGHLLGKMGEVSADLIKSQDPKDKLEELAAYALGDRRGVSGCEALGEGWLRGRRGRIQEDIEGRMVESPIEPVNGRAMRLTIDLPLQEAIYKRLEEAVQEVRAEETGDAPIGTGGSVVILDIPSREILAMVDYPAPDPNATLAEHREMAADAKNQPLLFRSVRGQYPPGSTVKPMLLAGALTDGKISADTRFHCDGMLLRDPPRWRCTGVHGDVDPVYAVQHSCNVFFCRIGERMELDGIGRWMSVFGLGRTAGTGLIEETSGRLSRASGVGPARNAAIGQGDVLATPLQIANMTATIASGVYRPVTLWAEGAGSRPAARLPIGDAAWRAAREGMFRAVNASGGTAYDRVTLEDAGDAIVLGKTGSAQASRKVLEWLYTCHLPDGTVVEKSAVSAEDLKRQLPGAEITGGRPSVKWPPAEVEDPTHAWFAGYVSSRSSYLQGTSPGGLHVAIVVLLEYGGHGGSAAGPVARDMLQMLVDRQNGRGELGGGELE